MNGNFICAEKKRYSNEEIPPSSPGIRFPFFCQLLLFQSNTLVINIPEIFSNSPTTIPTQFAIITQAPSKKMIWWKGFHHQVCHCHWFQGYLEYFMHTFELTSPKVSISLRFPMQKRILAWSCSGLFNFLFLFAPENCLEIF